MNVFFLSRYIQTALSCSRSTFLFQVGLIWSNFREKSFSAGRENHTALLQNLDGFYAGVRAKFFQSHRVTCPDRKEIRAYYPTEVYALGWLFHPGCLTRPTQHTSPDFVTFLGGKIILAKLFLVLSILILFP